MNYTVLSSAEYAYPDVFRYASSSDRADVFGARGGYASFQVVLSGVESDELAVSAEGFPAEIYALYPVLIERNQGITEENARPHMPERKAPYTVYDALMPYRGKVKVTDGAAGLYVAVPIARDAEPGVAEGALRVGPLTIPVRIETMTAVLPEETLKIIQGYSRNFEVYHGARPDSPEFASLNDAYCAKLRRMHQNMLYVGGVRCEDLGGNRYRFDFSGLEKQIEDGLAHGFRYFNGPSVGWRKSWHESTIFVNKNIPSMSYEGYCWLSQYLPALHDLLVRRGWLDIFSMGVADEPNAENCTEFRALCGLIRKFVPDIRLMDAMSYGNLHGALDVWVPLNAEYDRHRAEMETLRGNGDEIWFYVCCGPRGDGYINRFTDYSLLCTRAMFWGSYRYHLTGYLHWASNCYQSGISKYEEGKPYRQDPFIQSCPEHHNTDAVCYLPAGDTHLLYPGGYAGNGDVQEPWMSIRGENQRESVEEYELLNALSRFDKEAADRICEKVFRSFSDIEFDVLAFEKARRELMETCGRCMENK